MGQIGEFALEPAGAVVVVQECVEAVDPLHSRVSQYCGPHLGERVQPFAVPLVRGAKRGRNGGLAEIWLDGAKAATVDLYASVPFPRQLVFTRAMTPATSHKLEVRVLGRNGVSATGTMIRVDAFLVLR